MEWKLNSYSNKVKVNKDFETNIKGLYVAGDGAGITRGLMLWLL